MSANIETTATASAAEGDCRRGLSLRQLIETISSLRANPTFDDLQRWLAEVEVDRAEIEPYLKFREHTYFRTRVVRNAHVEMLVLCWRPGHYTSIHDHNGSYSSIRVVEGRMHETLYDFDPGRGLCETSQRHWEPGHVTVADIPDIHRVGNAEDSGRNMITLHCYSPPFDVIRTYQLGSTEIGELRPEAPREITLK